MSKKNDNPFGNDFGGTTVGEAEKVRWEFPGIGYNARQGIIYINEDQVDSLTLVPLALRQCKEVMDINDVIHRYPVNRAKAQMIDGDVTYRVQVACIVDGDIYVFGARSWTARASWLNPRSGQWRDDKFATGLWHYLDDHIAEMRTKHGVPTTPLCWELTLKPGDEITVGSGKNTSESRPLVLASAPVFVGKERVAEYEELYRTEELNEWVQEWKKVAQEQTAVDDEPAAGISEEELEGIPF